MKEKNQFVNDPMDAKIEEAYMEHLTDITPDLWDRIERGFEAEFSKKEKEDNVVSFADEKNAKEVTKKKKVKSRYLQYIIMGTAAAFIVALIPLGGVLRNTLPRSNVTATQPESVMDEAAEDGVHFNAVSGGTAKGEDFEEMPESVQEADRDSMNGIESMNDDFEFIDQIVNKYPGYDIVGADVKVNDNGVLIETMDTVYMNCSDDAYISGMEVAGSNIIIENKEGEFIEGEMEQDIVYKAIIVVKEQQVDRVIIME